MPITIDTGVHLLTLPSDEELQDEDGENLESDWHCLAMNLLIDVVLHFLRPRTDFFVGGNMFIYFDENNLRQVRGPDFFLVNGGVELNPPRRYWAVWRQNGRYPNLIIELSSRSTKDVDFTTKKDIYQDVFHTYEYFIYDPDTRKLDGWRLVQDEYRPIAANDRGWLWCDELGLWLGFWDGAFQRKEERYLRFFDAEGNLVLTDAEASRKETAELRQVMLQDNDIAATRLEEERRRADAAQAEVERLRALLTAAQPKNGNP